MSTRRNVFSHLEIVFAAVGSFVILFIAAPLLSLLLAGSPRDILAAGADQEVTASIRLTLRCALYATIACAAFGIPLAYVLARKRFFGSSLLMAVIDLPIMIPHSSAGLALLTLIGRKSMLGSTVGGLVGTEAGISVAMAFVSIPFLINAARNGFAAVPVEMEKAARTLGASQLRVFMTICVPMAWRDILSGMVMMWARGISEFGAVVIVAYYPMTTPVLVFERFNDFGLSYARAPAALLVLICMFIFIVLHGVARRRSTGG